MTCGPLTGWPLSNSASITVVTPPPPPTSTTRVGKWLPPNIEHDAGRQMAAAQHRPIVDFAGQDLADLIERRLADLVGRMQRDGDARVHNFMRPQAIVCHPRHDLLQRVDLAF